MCYHRYECFLSTVVNIISQVVIYESLMLMREYAAAESDGGDMKHLPTATSISGTVRRFISAVFNTKSLAKPPYIEMTREKHAQQTVV